MNDQAARDNLEIAESALARMRTSDDASALEAIESRYPEMQAALDWFLDAGRADEAYRLATALVPFWMATKRIDDGDLWFSRGLGHPSASEATAARAVYDHGYLVFWAGQHEVADQRFIDARTRAGALGDGNLAALALAGSARVALYDDGPRAIRLLREALDVTTDEPDSLGRSSALHVLGVALQMSGDLEGARQVMTERLERGRARGHQPIVYIESANLSMVERKLGNLDRAEALSRDALRIVSGKGEQLATAWVINGLAAVTAAKGEHERAATLLGSAESLLAQGGGQWPPDELEQHDSTAALLTGRMEPAAIAAARARGAAMTFDDAVSFALG
jgi:tetratricopeptide (TPR) repeat protein